MQPAKEWGSFSTASPVALSRHITNPTSSDTHSAPPPASKAQGAGFAHLRVQPACLTPALRPALPAHTQVAAAAAVFSSPEGVAPRVMSTDIEALAPVAHTVAQQLEFSVTPVTAAGPDTLLLFRWVEGAATQLSHLT